MKIIIAGGRDFNNYEMLEQEINKLQLNITEIISGGAKGADYLGQLYAQKYNIPLKIFKAEWELYGKAAGPIRNKQMGNYADYLIAFWDGQSKGTKNMINYMKQINKHGTVIKYKSGE